MRKKRAEHPLCRRAAAVMLVLCMLLTMVPTVAAAGNVASVNGTEYATLANAITAAQNASAAGKPEEAYTVTLLSDAEADQWGEYVSGKVILNLAGASISAPAGSYSVTITVGSSGNLTLKGGGDISGRSSSAIENGGILTVMDTVKLTSPSNLYGLTNKKTANLYGGTFSAYNANTTTAIVNLKDGANTYKAVYTANETEFSIPDGKCKISEGFKVVPAAPPAPETPVVQIGSTTYTSLNDAFLSLNTAPGTAEAPIVIEVLADCGATSTMAIPVSAHAVLKSGEGGPYTVSRLEGCTGALISVYGSLTVENLVLDGGAAAGLSANAALVTLVQAPGDPVPHLTLGQGAVVRNNVNQSSSGGGVYIWGGALTLDGGKIYGNSVTGSYQGGGGVYLEAYDPNTALELLGGEIRDNTAAFAGGVAVGSGATVTASGAPVVRGNKQDGNVESNLYFSDTPLKLTGTLFDGAYLGVTQESGIGGVGVLVPVAEGDGYTISDTDFSHFHKDAASAIHELRFQGGAVSLYEPVRVAYAANGGEGDVPRDAGKYAKGDTVTVLFDPPLTRPGHFFKGWATRSSATDPAYAEGGTTEITVPGYGHISLFAVWEQNPQVLTGAASDITTTSAKLTGNVTVYGNFTPVSGFYLTKPTGREELTAGGSGAISTALIGLTPGAEYEYQAFTDYNGVRYLGESRRFRTQPEAAQPPTGAIGGDVINNTGSACTVTVTIEEGNTIRATQTLENVGDGASAGFSFTALPDGAYNVVADNGDYKVTRMVIVRNGLAVVDVVLALGKTQSVVEIVTPDTPPAAVDGLPEQFDNMVDDDKTETGYTQSDKDVVTSGGTVELKLAVERKEKESLVSEDADLITKAAAGQTIPIYLDLSVIKSVIPRDGSVTKTTLTSVPKLLTVALPLPGEAVGKQNITVYRVHNGVAAALPKADPGADGEWAEIGGGSIVLHVRQFSTYAVGYTPPAPSGGGSATYPTWNPFVDVADEDWFHDSVRYVYENGLMIGTSDTTFSPYLDTSRGMIVTILWRIEGEPKDGTPNPYPDVTPGAYYYDAVAWGDKHGIVLGYDTGSFGPADPITREQLAAILWRYAQFKKYDVSIGESTNILSYKDFDQISEYAIPALQWAVGAGIMNGKGDGVLDPRGHATRAETAAMLERFLLGER